MIYKYVKKKIRFGLVFFCSSLFFTCHETLDGPTTFRLHYEDGKVSSIDFVYTHGEGDFQLFVEKESDTPVLGKWTDLSKGKYHFAPVLPFTPNQTYILRDGEKIIGSFTASRMTPPTNPRILAIYPSTDTVPENLLKVYLKFSEPMQEVGHPLDFIEVIDKTEGIEKEIFLKMESELWNRDHDLLTLWLDPGRIKTDLIPNKQLGMPILKGHTYEISILGHWKSAQGQPLVKSYTKMITANSRDTEKPSLSDWTLDIPKANTREELTIHFDEPMDALLSLESFSVFTGTQEQIHGRFQTRDGEKKVTFIPSKSWEKGTYSLHVNPILEDLAGNNLSRLFDEDLTVRNMEKDYSTNKPFEIK